MIVEMPDIADQSAKINVPKDKFAYVLVRIVRGTQPGEPVRSYPACWSENEAGTSEGDDGLNRGWDVEFELHRMPAHRAHYCEEFAPHRFEIVDEGRAQLLLALLRTNRGSAETTAVAEALGPVEPGVSAELIADRNNRRNEKLARIKHAPVMGQTGPPGTTGSTGPSGPTGGGPPGAQSSEPKKSKDPVNS
jgi:hypothetical protein